MSVDDNDLTIIASAAYLIINEPNEKSKKRPRRQWMSPFFKNRRSLINDLKSEISLEFFENFCRITATNFEFLLNLIGAQISKKETFFRETIPAADRLLLTLRFLASGDSYSSLMFTFKISKPSISEIIPEVCLALIEHLKEYVKMPATEDEWLQVAYQFEHQWDFPHVCGAIDGKHCAIQAPINSGSDYFNYKQHFSVVLLGIADADYCFLFADVGCQGRISDGGVLKNTTFWKNLRDNELKLPPAEPLHGRERKVPYVFVGDDAFSLGSNLMKAYPVDQQKGSKKRIFNYRLCRARRVIENTFGIMSAYFRVLRKPMLLSPEKATKVVLACVYLHNFLRRSRLAQNNTTQPNFDNDNVNDSTIVGTNPADPETIRNEFAEYFLDQGKVRWQDNYA